MALIVKFNISPWSDIWRRMDKKTICDRYTNVGCGWEKKNENAILHNSYNYDKYTKLYTIYLFFKVTIRYNVIYIKNVQLQGVSTYFQAVTSIFIMIIINVMYILYSLYITYYIYNMYII